MPRYAIGARLYLRPARGKSASRFWYIRGDGKNLATGYAENEKDKALEMLAAHAPYTKGRPTLIVDNAPKQFQPQESVVYFVSVDQPDFPIKIGYASDMKSRLGGLQNSFPFDLVVLATTPGHRYAERDLHIAFHASRIRGEWFYRTPELMRHIKAINREQNPPDVDAMVDARRARRS